MEDLSKGSRKGIDRGIFTEERDLEVDLEDSPKSVDCKDLRG